jgi:hypothetical protein
MLKMIEWLTRRDETRRDEKNDGTIEWFRNETRKVLKRDEKNDGTIEWFRNETRREKRWNS